MYKGCIVEESLKDNRILNNFKIKDVLISSAENPKDRWHIYTVYATEKQIMLISNNLKTKKNGGWYAHFWNKDGIVHIAYPKGKVFVLDYNDKSTWQDAINYGLKIGVPMEQLDFTIE